MNPEISVVIPAYNAAQYLKDSISSVIDQTFSNWELIVIDDGSTDNTSNIVKGFQADQRIRLIRQENKGVSAARNTGIKAATGKYIAFLDADDFFLPQNLQKKFDILSSNPDIDFIYSDMIHCDNSLKDLSVEKGTEADNLLNKVLLWETETIPCLPSNLVIRTSDIQGKIAFDEYLSNCADRFMKMSIAQSLKGKYIPQALFKYRHSPGSMSTKVWLLEKDETYIIKQIKEKNIGPAGAFRRKAIANIYLILAGSWYKNEHKLLKAIKYGIMATITYPPAFTRLVRKVF